MTIPVRNMPGAIFNRIMEDKNNKNMPAYNVGASEGIYIHIPFCLSKCVYCDFTSYAGCGSDEQRRYFDALNREAELYAKLRTADPQNAAAQLPDTIFIGGGTPSTVDASYIAGVLERLPRAQNAEITIECNPAAVLDSRLNTYRAAGINRLSMGVQSFNDAELRFLGRPHTAAEAARSFRRARQAGFDNINIDLIFGFPGQTQESWKKTLDTALELSPDHISFYSLQIEEGTPLYEKFRRDEVEQIPDEINRAMYRTAVERLTAAGYEHYEISNAAKPGRRCRHNIKYWSMARYTGLGAAAHSFDGQCRYYNPDALTEYEAAVEQKQRTGDLTAGSYKEELSVHDRMTDYIFTGLRLTEGLDLELFKQMFGEDLLKLRKEEISQFINDGLLEIVEKKNLRFTGAGLDISNYVIGELIV